MQKAISADTQRRARLKEYAIMGVTLDTVVTEVIKLYDLSKKKIKSNLSEHLLNSID